MTNPPEITFQEEAEELLRELDATLVALESQPQDRDLVERALRALLTIKSASAAYGSDQVVNFIHDLDAAFERARTGLMPVTGDLLATALRAKEHIRVLLRGPAGPDVVETGQALLAQVRELTGAGAVPPSTEVRRTLVGTGPVLTYRIRFKPHVNLLQKGTNPALLLQELHALGHCRVVAQTDLIPPLTELVPEHCYLFWDVILTTTAGLNAIRDVFIFVEDDADLAITVIDDGGTGDSDQHYKKLGEILVDRGDISRDALQEVLRSQKRLGTLLEERGLVFSDRVEAALVEQEMVRQVRRARAGSAPEFLDRIPSHKLDAIVDLVGELILTEARLGHLAEQRRDLLLLNVVEDLGRLTGLLRERTLHLRMLPVSSVLERFKPLVAQWAEQLGKEVELSLSGLDTELDKVVLEQLAQPLDQLVRNCIQHGVEPPTQRQAAHKPRMATVALSAAHAGSSVVITVRDDGEGLDGPTLLERAVKRGVLAPGTSPSHPELCRLVFQPGFSEERPRAPEAGERSGLEEVRRSVERLRGSVEMESRPGEGTAVTITLPVTLSISDGLMVCVADESFVIPLSLVEECVELSAADVAEAHGNRLVALRGEMVPYLRLAGWLGQGHERPEREQVVITKVDGKRFGVAVDRVVGQCQAIVKSLGRLGGHARGVAGATILGNGTVALILDVPALCALCAAGAPTSGGRTEPPGSSGAL